MISQKKDVIYVVTYDDRTSIKKIIFQNDISLDILPDVQELLYRHRQTWHGEPEAGGLLIGYENANTGDFTVAGATKPQHSDIRSRVTLFLGKQHREQLEKIESPYGYIGTWHTHPSKIPIPSTVDICDWKKCIKQNHNSTNGLVFIISGTESYRIWLLDSNSLRLIEGEML